MKPGTIWFLLAGFGLGALGFSGIGGDIFSALAKALGATSIIFFFILQFFGFQPLDHGGSVALKPIPSSSSPPRRH